MEYDDIVDCKASCDGKQYFDLFDKHIPELKDGSAVLLYAISNLDCIANIISKNPRSIYYICDTETIFDLLKLTNENTKLVYVENLDAVIEKDMKFDCIVMNPPYSRSLHLKILAEAIKHLKDDESVCVNLSPVRWLQDPLAKYKKKSDLKRFEENVAKHIEHLEIISTIESQCLFNILINTDLGIYKCVKQNISTYAYYDEWKKTTNEKHFNAIKLYWNYPSIEQYSEGKNTDKWFVPIRLITNPARATFYNICSNIGPLFNGKTKNGIFYKDAMYKSKTFSDDRQLNGLWFNTQAEADNFYNSTNTVCYKYFCSLILRDVNISLTFLPWLGDAINPRTGLKGYEGEWTDDDLYEFFNITPEEQKVIEETMAKYK